ncbi:MAG: VCBS repeat-containing protein [Polyangiaceae bacterium]|nr:VCBS repeat-containing protein [Polyangiaceae bacterium]
MKLNCILALPVPWWITGCDLVAGIGEYCIEGAEGCGTTGTGGAAGTSSTGGTGGQSGSSTGSATSPQVMCGDGKLEGNEECDDNNTADADGCEADCTLPKCGNGIVDPGEVCFGSQDPALISFTETYSLALFDCNGDGALDLIISGAVVFANNVSNFGIQALPNDMGHFAEAIFTEALSSIVGLEPAIGADGEPELIGVHTYKSKTMWMRGLGECQLQWTEGMTTAATLAGVTDVTPFNADGMGTIDVAKVYLPNVGDSAPIWFTLNQNIDEDVPGPSFANANPTFIAAGDLMGDSLDELVIGIPEYKQIGIFLNNDLSFSTPLNIPTLGLSAAPVDAAIGDLDKDGDNDIVTANLESDSIAVLKNLGSGAFGTQVPEPQVQGSNGVAAAKPKSIVLGDMNNDGYLDAVTANSDDSTGKSSVSVFLNDGKGKLLLATKASFPLVGTDAPFEVGRQPVSVKVGDLNGDGVLDIVTANAFVENGSSSVSVILSNP